VGHPPDINFYRYASNAPVDRVDPLGWSSCASGKCDCPGGHWASGALTFELYGNIKIATDGGLVFAGVLVCTSNATFNVPFVTGCGSYGVGISPRPPLTQAPAKPYGGGADAGAAVFGCRGINCKEDLAGPEQGKFLQIGPAYGFTEGTSSGGGCGGIGAGFEAGLGLGKFSCYTWIGMS
jgi:hypothetical protein